MSISHSFAVRQIARLGALAFAHERLSTVDAASEFVCALKAVSRSEEHARAVIDELVECNGCPEPADIRKLAWSLLSEEDRLGTTAHCRLCQGLGWIHHTLLRGGVVIDAASPCSCRTVPPKSNGLKPAAEWIKSLQLEAESEAEA